LRRLRLAGLFLSAIGLAINFYVGIGSLLFNLKFGFTSVILEWIGLALIIVDAFLFRIPEEAKRKQNLSQNTPLPV
jgi:hypothetical protein